MTAEPAPLAGIGVLVTRPAGRGANLGARIEKLGGEAVAFPVINIAPPADEGALLAAVEGLGEIDLVIFVSVHAVNGVATLLRPRLRQRSVRIPAGTRVAAVGPKTAAQCARAGIAVDFVARERIDSEGLLAELRGFDVAGKKVRIFRGQSGRETLKQGLEARGAGVRYVESYRREIADPPPEPLQPLLKRWRAGQIHLVVVSSAAVLDALRTLLGPCNRGLLEETPVCAYSRRVAEYCRAAGAGAGARAEILAAEKPTDESAVAAIVEWAAGRTA